MCVCVTLQLCVDRFTYFNYATVPYVEATFIMHESNKPSTLGICFVVDMLFMAHNHLYANSSDDFVLRETTQPPGDFVRPHV